MTEYVEKKIIHYCNEYGILDLKLSGFKASVSSIRVDEIKEDYLYPLETIEKVVLITENWRIQTVFSLTKKVGAIVFHRSSSLIELVSINYISYLGKLPPEKILDDLNRKAIR